MRFYSAGDRPPPKADSPGPVPFSGPQILRRHDRRGGGAAVAERVGKALHAGGGRIGGAKPGRQKLCFIRYICRINSQNDPLCTGADFPTQLFASSVSGSHLQLFQLPLFLTYSSNVKYSTALGRQGGRAILRQQKDCLLRHTDVTIRGNTVWRATPSARPTNRCGRWRLSAAATVLTQSCGFAGLPAAVDIC